MSNNVSAVYTTQMTNLIKKFYIDNKDQNLPNAVRRVTDVMGSTYDFIGGGYVTAQKVVPGSIASPTNPTYAKMTVNLEDFAADCWSNIFDKNKITFDELSYLSKIIGQGLSRRMNQVIIDALNSGTLTVTKPTIDVRQVCLLKGNGDFCSNTTPVSADRVPFSLGALKAAAKIMDELGVPSEDRYCVYTPAAQDALLSDTNVTNIMTNTVKTLVDGTISYFMGFKFIKIGQYPEGGLPASAFTGAAAGSTAFFFHSEALGLAIGMEPNVVINYIAQARSYMVDGRLSLGAVPIDQRGIIKVVHSSL